MLSKKIRGLVASPILLLALLTTTSAPVHAANPDMPVGATSKDWTWFDAAVGPAEIYRNFDSGFHYPTWATTQARALHPNAPRYDYSFNIPPAQAVAGLWDARLRTFVRSTPINTILSIWHEPEQEIEAKLFSAADFKAMMVRFKGIVTEANALDGGTRLVSVVLMVSTFTGFKNRNPDTYWPGLEGADLIAVDAYGSPTRNSVTPPGYTNGRNWRTGDVLLTPVYNFAVSKGAQWGVSEFGYLVDTTNFDHKAQAISQAVAFARENDAVMFEYFDSFGSRGDWRLRYAAPPIPSTSTTSPAVLAIKAAIAE